MAAEWARVLCASNSRYPLSSLLSEVIERVWRADRALDLELQSTPEDIQFACGRLARNIQHERNSPDPTVATIITLMSRVYSGRGCSTVAAHGTLAEALVDAGRSRDLVHDGTGRHPGVTFLGDALMLILHPPI